MPLSPPIRAAGLFLTILTSLAPLTCGDDGAPTGTAVARDSAGIAIVENGPLAAAPVWSVPDSPLVSLGGQPGDPGHDLNRVVAGRFLPGGRILVAEGGSAQLRVFDSTGRFLHAVGRQGSGPGEFASYVGLVPSAGDSLLTVDGAQRYSVFGPDLSFVRSFRVERHPSYRFATVWGRMTDALVGLAVDWDSAVATGTVHRSPLRFLRLDLEGRYLGVLLIAPGIERRRILTSEGGRSFPADDEFGFGRQTVWAVTADGMVLGTDERFELRVVGDTGALQRIIRVQEAPVPVTQADRDAHIERRLEPIRNWRPASPAMREEQERRIRAAVFSDRFPFYGAITPGDGGTLWVQRYQRPSDRHYDYVVFDSVGRVAATVRLPDRVRPFLFASDRVLARWQDEDDVEYVRVYPIRR